MPQFPTWLSDRAMISELVQQRLGFLFLHETISERPGLASERPGLSSEKPGLAYEGTGLA